MNGRGGTSLGQATTQMKHVTVRERRMTNEAASERRRSFFELGKTRQETMSSLKDQFEDLQGSSRVFEESRTMRERGLVLLSFHTFQLANSLPNAVCSSNLQAFLLALVQRASFVRP